MKIDYTVYSRFSIDVRWIELVKINPNWMRKKPLTQEKLDPDQSVIVIVIVFAIAIAFVIVIVIIIIIIKIVIIIIIIIIVSTIITSS